MNPPPTSSLPPKKVGGGGWNTASRAAITSPPSIWPIRHTLSASASYCSVAFLRNFKLQHSLLPQISVTVQSTTTYAMPGSQSTTCRVYTDTCTARNWLTLHTKQEVHCKRLNVKTHTYIDPLLMALRESLPILKPRKAAPWQVGIPSLTTPHSLPAASSALHQLTQIPVAKRERRDD